MKIKMYIAKILSVISTIYLQKLYLLCFLWSTSGGFGTRSLKKLFARLNWYEILVSEFVIFAVEIQGSFSNDVSLLGGT